MPRQPRTGAGLRLDGIGKSFGSFVAVKGVDLEIARGEFLTLLGPSGSGKTTLLMMIAGFLDPTAGDIRLDGQTITALAPEKRNFGMVFQGYALFPHMTVAQNIAYPLEVRRQPADAIRARVAGMLELVQLSDFAHRLPRQLSGGQQQRVALARALAFGPPVLLLDEPLGALDRKMRGEVQAELKALHRKVGTTFIYVTHDQEEALSMSDRVVIMNHGRVVQVGAPDELYERPASVFAAGFLGKSNFLHGTVAAAEGADLICDIAGQHFRQQSGQAIAPGSPVTLALRPEKIGIAGPGTAAPANRLPGRVTGITYLGSILEVEVDAGPADHLVAQLPAWRNRLALEPGQPVQLEWTADAAVIVSADED